MITWIAARLLFLFNISICSTLKYKITNEPPAPKLFALWHGQTFPLFYWARHRKLCLTPIETWRGGTIAYLAKKYGYITLRIKEKGTPLERSKNLTELITQIKNGYETAIPVDGPPPPLVSRKAKPGILYLSRATGVPIVPIKIKMKKKCICFWRWDKYEIPLPFSEIILDFGKPLVASEKTPISELEQLLS
jgi:lysophospholipid acyltransferase (LPLAT)-like uncharacterized protein